MYSFSAEVVSCSTGLLGACSGRTLESYLLDILIGEEKVQIRGRSETGSEEKGQGMGEDDGWMEAAEVVMKLLWSSSY
jgi:hypothetical protein